MAVSRFHMSCRPHSAPMWDVGIATGHTIYLLSTITTARVFLGHGN